MSIHAFREEQDLAGHCGRCRTSVHGADGLRTTRHWLYCSEACIRAEQHEQCPGCDGWHYLGDRPTVTTRGAYCSETCVVAHERALLEQHREREHRPSACRVCLVHPSTPAYSWCCSVQCERAYFAGGSDAVA